MKAERSRPKSRAANAAFDPGELEDLIHTPAVGLGVSSHLLTRPEVPAKSAPGNLTTVVRYTERADLADAGASAELWRTEAGSLIAGRAVRPIRQADDVLGGAERKVIELLRRIGHPLPGGERLATAGYDQIGKGTGLSRKTVQRTIASLREKDVLVVDQPADIYTRAATTYRLRDEPAVLEAHQRRGRRWVARVGPGTVYVTPVVK